jgi:hypothetical protein
MRRRCYLAALLILQLALLNKLASPFARVLSIDMAPGIASEGWPAMLQLALTAAAIAGTSIALIFPGLALSRHHSEGIGRFETLPHWTVTLTLAGSLMVTAGAIVLSPLPIVPEDCAISALALAHSAVAAGLAVAAAGALGGELLLSTSVRHAPRSNARRATGRIEVVYPPELRTRAS